MRVRWNDIEFDAPDGRDDSAIVIADPQIPPGWNLTVRCEALDGVAFAAFAAGLKAPAGVVVDRRSERSVGARAVVIVEQHLRADRQSLKQWQALVDDGARALVVTMTAREAHAVAAHAAFERALTSLKRSA